MGRTVMTLSGIMIAAAALGIAACSNTSAPPAPLDAPALADAVRLDAVVGHLQELERIATENGGNRALGTIGYDASVDYVAGKLREAGFDVQTPEFDVTSFDVNDASLTVDGAPVELRVLGMSPSTGPDGITARVVRVPADDTPGCEGTDYDGLDAAGAIAVVDRGVCPFSAKQKAAAERGAAALLVVNNEPGPLAGGTLGEDGDELIPAAGVSGNDGAALAAAETATLVVDTTIEDIRSRNVIAQTATGGTDDVVVVGAHLDSVPEGPGINDNGSGVAAVLETALQLGSGPTITNAVRFVFWGAEETGLVGSTRYVESLSDDERDSIALYLNFDMLGSPNPGYLVYDGDDSDAVGAAPGPEGSAGIEQTFRSFFESRGVAADGTDFDGRSDYGPFVEAGIPAGGVFSGADERKSADQAGKWGGEVDTAFDPNYHSPQDTLGNIDRDALAVTAASVGYGVGTYAQSLDGVPTGDARDRARSGN
ncbi:M28 family peptidase [Rhodococcus zopfii]|uniref:M28 family peptidase n=1 Tax=Rhodococcus zopfii TaxID=43772 RepID=UPI001F112B0F|nr:M28 family peptidase [Rhodococcus zopfii]